MIIILALVSLTIKFMLFTKYYKIYIDVDECSNNIGYCDQICINDDGSYHCDCMAGFVLSSNGIVCQGKVLV